MLVTASGHLHRRFYWFLSSAKIFRACFPFFFLSINKEFGRNEDHGKHGNGMALWAA